MTTMTGFNDHCMLSRMSWRLVW